MEDGFTRRRGDAEAFNGNNGRSIELREIQDAGVDGAVIRIRRTSRQNRARAAIAFFADDLRARRGDVLTQVVGERLE